MSDERRKFKRLPINIKLIIESLYKQDAETVDHLNETITVTNISKSGIGFICDHDMPLDYYFNAKIIIDDEKYFFSVLKIIRKSSEDNHFNYGCEFVGLADILSRSIDDYEKEIL